MAGHRGIDVQNPVVQIAHAAAHVGLLARNGRLVVAAHGNQRISAHQRVATAIIELAERPDPVEVEHPVVDTLVGGHFASVAEHDGHAGIERSECGADESGCQNGVAIKKQDEFSVSGPPARIAASRGAWPLRVDLEYACVSMLGLIDAVVGRLRVDVDQVQGGLGVVHCPDRVEAPQQSRTLVSTDDDHRDAWLVSS